MTYDDHDSAQQRDLDRETSGDPPLVPTLVPTLVPCLICGKELAAVDSAEDMQPYGGVICTTQGNYGSRVFESFLVGGHLAFLLCDDCLVARTDRVRIARVQKPRATVTYESWDSPPSS